MYKRERLNRIIKTSLSVLCGVLLFILSTGHANAEDTCLDDPNKTEPGICGCGIPDTDTDTDSDDTPDCYDTDDDNDGVLDVSDAFPRYPSETVDSDGDGWGDNQDQVSDDNRFSQPNILQNPGAESGSENWSLGDAGGDGEIKADAAHTGTKSFFLTSTGGDTLDIRWQSDDYAMPAGVQTYHFRGWMKTDSTTRTRIQAVPTIGASKSYRAIDAAAGTSDWVLYSNTKTETGDITSFQFRLIQGGTTDGQLGWFDDLALFTVIPGDNDSDTIQDNIDPDDDNDGVKDGADAFPLDDSESRDTDGDGTGNNADTDDDGDGIPDVSDNYPLDDTRPVNTAPTISDITNQTTPEDTALGPIGFTIGDDLTAVGDLTVSAVSNNQTVVPDAGITLGGADANRTITLTPATDALGTATITVSVNDGNLAANDTLDVTVTSVNDPPTISDIADQETFKNNFIAPLGFTIGDDLTTAGALTVSAVSNNQTLIPDANLILSGSDANRTLKITPAEDQLGTATITITVNDGTLSTNEAFTVDVLTDVITLAGLSPALWLDARDANTIVLTSNKVSSWTDKSGSGKNAAQTNTDLRPVYDDTNGVVQFDGTSFEALEAPHIPYGTGNKISVYAITRPDTCTSGTRWIIAKGPFSSTMGYSLAQYCNDLGGKFMATVTGSLGKGVTTDGDTHLAAQIVDGTNNELWVNGALIESVTGLNFDVTGSGNKAYNTANPVSIGGVTSKNLTGDIGEVLIFQENLSDLNKAKLEGYLAKKWALRGNLPDDHPFKTQDFGVLPGQSLSVAENAANGTALGTLQGISFAGDHDFTNWEIVEVKTIYQDIFIITVGGEIQIDDNTELDFEKTKRHIMTVRVYDDLADAWSDPVEVEINVTDVSDGQTKNYSLLWGENGELWDPNGRLPDYSYAGYHAENADIPDITVRVVVSADDTGTNDASDIVQDAIDVVSTAIGNGDYTTGTVRIPAGTYKFEHPVFVRTSGIVIRGDVDGEGNPTTNIYSPYSAEDAMNIVDGIAGIRSNTRE